MCLLLLLLLVNSVDTWRHAGLSREVEQIKLHLSSVDRTSFKSCPCHITENHSVYFFVPCKGPAGPSCLFHEYKR